MIFNIHQITTSTTLEQISALIKKQKIDIHQMGVFKDIACKIALIQNTISPKLNKPKHYILSLNSEKNEQYLKTDETSLINNFNNTNLLEVHIIEIEKQNNLTLKSIDFDQYKKGLDMGIEISLQAFNSGSNCISFGTTHNESNIAASLLTAEITNSTIEECTYFNPNISEQEQKNNLEKIIAKKAMYSPMTLADIMCDYGQLDIITIVGGILKAAELGMVILIDSFTVSSALLFAHQLNENVIDYCIFCNQSNNKGHQVIIDYFEKKTILNLDYGTDIGLGIPITLPIINGSITWLKNALK